MARSIAVACMFWATSAARFGSWNEHVKTSEGIASQEDPAELVRLLRATNQTLYGLMVDSCALFAQLPAVLNATAGLPPPIEVFAIMPSHSVLGEYCPSWLSPGGDSLDWPAIGAALGRASVPYPHFLGLHIDDFVGTLPSPGHTHYWRGGTDRVPCRSLADVDAMTSAMRLEDPRLKFLPLVYMRQLGCPSL
eukprot:gene6822-6512_t